MSHHPLLEDVFKRSGLPTYTFVEPAEYNHLKIALRTPGRGVVVEGPSGIGKTTAVRRAAADVGLGARAQMLSGRNRHDQELIAEIPNMTNTGVVVIDDFHRLDDSTKHAIADYLKELADQEASGTKVVLIGINRAGDSLVHFAADLNNRIDTIHFEVNDTAKVRELISKGEEALNIQIACANALAEDAGGSFHIAQILCHEICLNDGVTECSDQKKAIVASVESVKGRVLTELSRTFLERAVEFARGRRFRREGRAPYMHLLLRLAKSDDWTCSIDQVLAESPKIRGSLGQVVDKGHLADFLKERPELRDLFHYDGYTRVLAVEDPKLMYFMRNLLWSKFVRQVGFISVDFRSKYDFALSFAGEDRQIAEKLRDALQDHEIEVFYDKDEQHRIWVTMSNCISRRSTALKRDSWFHFSANIFRRRFGPSSSRTNLRVVLASAA
jgi:hypothetical protein